MTFYLTLFFIALNGAAQGMNCKTCWVKDYTVCSHEKEKECPGSKCMTISEYCNVNNYEYNTIQKTCAIEGLCNVCFSASTNHGFQMRLSAECNDGENSNANLNFKKICEDPLPPNGFKCPSCFAVNTTSGCTADGEVMCGGNEFECFKYGGTLQLSNAEIMPCSVQGCITRHGCRLGFKVVPGTCEFNRDHFTCVEAEKV